MHKKLGNFSLIGGGIIGLVIGIFVYGRILAHPIDGPIGFKKALIIYVVLGFILAVIALPIFAIYYFSSPSSSALDNEIQSNATIPNNASSQKSESYQDQQALAPSAQPAPATPVTPLQEPPYPPVPVFPAIPLTPASAPATAAAPPRVQPWVVAQSPMGGFVGGLSPQNKVVGNSWDYPGAKADYNPATGVYRIDNGLPQGVQAAVVRRR